jgi:DegV family protein with EDD domain
MANIAVLTDSVACIPRDLAQELNIRVIPAALINVDGKTYIEGETITATEAYQLIKDDPDRFVTSAIQPNYLVNVYEELAKKSKDILFITIASALTAVNKTGLLAGEAFMEKHPGVTIKVVDSRACASTQGLVVLAAARAAAQGKSLDDCAALAESVRKRAGGIMMLDTLRYVYRTGRMSKTASKIVSLFNIKPINKVSDQGTIEMVERTRKTSEGIEKMLNIIEKDGAGQPMHFMVTHAAAPESAGKLADELNKRFKCLSMITGDYSPIMGYGAGPGALFVGYHPEIK